MGMIYCLLGRGCSGKDTVYGRLLADAALALKPLVTYTTRPRRTGEAEGREYHFATLAEFAALKESGCMIESRTYHTVQGDWHYFTMDDGYADGEADYLLIGTLESYKMLRAYYGARVAGLYLAIDEEERFRRAVAREERQEKKDYHELCRRFLADHEDFRDEKLAEVEVSTYRNDDLEACIGAIKARILRDREETIAR